MHSQRQPFHLLLRPQAMDATGLMASDELSEERLAEWLANADTLFRLIKVGLSIL